MPVRSFGWGVGGSGDQRSVNDDELLAAFVTTANMGLDVVNISFGGYTDISTPEGALIYQAYIDAVAYARSKGTIIVASAGNEHVRVGAGGRVLSHGQLTSPGSAPEDFPDLFGQVELPGGAPGVVDVSATNRVNVPASATCPPGTIGDPGDPDADPPVPADNNATCKPASDPHQAAGPGRHNQLAYHSTYGPRIDIAGPGGARNFNVPVWDRGGTPGFPYHPSLRKHPGALIARLKRLANDNPRNLTQAVSATDTSPGGLSGLVNVANP
jgi:hypothetical protein